MYKKEDASHSKKSVKENPISQSPNNSDEKSKDKVQPENKDSLSDTIHKVIKVVPLSEIVKIYIKKYSPGLTVEGLINYNIKKSKLKDNEKKSLEKNKTIEGMELLIPKIPKIKEKVK